MSNDLFRYPVALLGGLLFAALLFIAIQGLLLRPSTPGNAVQGVLQVDRVRLEEPTTSELRPRETPPRPTPPQPSTAVAPVEAMSSAPIDLGALSQIQGIDSLSLGISQRSGKAWGAVDSSLVILHRSEPVYPPTAARRGVEGWVKLQFTVDAAGEVADAVVLDAQPPNLFDRAALQAVRLWRFKPRSINGEMVSTPVVQTLNFRLDR